MNRKPKPFDIVSSATLRDSDLLAAMLNTLEQYRPQKYAKVIAEGREWQKKLGDFGYFGYLIGENPAVDTDIVFSGDDADRLIWFIYETLPDLMQEIAPAGCSYGTHPGDGALLGYWPDEDSDLWE